MERAPTLVPSQCGKVAQDAHSAVESPAQHKPILHSAEWARPCDVQRVSTTLRASAEFALVARGMSTIVVVHAIWDAGQAARLRMVARSHTHCRLQCARGVCRIEVHAVLGCPRRRVLSTARRAAGVMLHYYTPPRFIPCDRHGAMHNMCNTEMRSSIPCQH